MARKKKITEVTVGGADGPPVVPPRGEIIVTQLVNEDGEAFEFAPPPVATLKSYAFRHDIGGVQEMVLPPEIQPGDVFSIERVTAGTVEVWVWVR